MRWIAAIAAVALAVGAVTLWKAREARAAAEPARRLLAEIAPDLAAAREARERLAQASYDAATRPPRGVPGDFFGAVRPAGEESSSRPVDGAALELRTTALSWASAPVEALSKGIASAEAAGHRLAGAEIDPARPVGNVRARLVFETILPSRYTTP